MHLLVGASVCTFQTCCAYWSKIQFDSLILITFPFSSTDFRLISLHLFINCSSNISTTSKSNPLVFFYCGYIVLFLTGWRRVWPPNDAFRIGNNRHFLTLNSEINNNCRKSTMHEQKHTQKVELSGSMLPLINFWDQFYGSHQ